VGLVETCEGQGEDISHGRRGEENPPVDFFKYQLAAEFLGKTGGGD
jgi:hypothetical protein